MLILSFPGFYRDHIKTFEELQINAQHSFKYFPDPCLRQFTRFAESVKSSLKK